MIRIPLKRGGYVGALVLLAGGLSSCATWQLDGQQSPAAAAQSAISGRGNVNVHVLDDGTALVSGWVQDSLSEQRVVRALQRHPEVALVVSGITETPWRD